MSDNLDYKKINKQFEHTKREYLDDVHFDNIEKKEDKPKEIKKGKKEKRRKQEIEITKTSTPVNIPLKIILFICKVIFLFILCFLIFSVSRYNYLQEKTGGDVITFESVIDNVKDSTIDLKH